MSIELDLPTVTDLRPRITVIGVGGAGGNAVNNMIATGLKGVNFVVANTDAQALSASSAEYRIQLGVNLTEGLGAGSKPEIGEAAAEEAIDEIRAQVSGSHMVFVAAGMGGGTGTGAAAVVARIAHEMDILTVGVVTKPFHFEGNRRMRAAEAGIAELRNNVDTLIAIPNQNLFRIANEKTTFAEAFELADQVLHAGISCITDLIVREGLINLDFADVRAIMLDMGAAMMGTGEASGERRAVEAAEQAIANPLLDDVTLKGARGLLVSISGSDDLTLYDVDEAANRVRDEVDPEANIIVGATYDDSLGDKIRVSIVASGLKEAAAEPATIAAPQSSTAAAPPASPQAGPAGAPGPMVLTSPQTNAPLSPVAHQKTGLKGRLQGAPVPQRAGGPSAPHMMRSAPTQSLSGKLKSGPAGPGGNAGSGSGGGRPADDVTIELGPPKMLAPAAAPDRSASRERSTADGSDARVAFMPAAPAPVRRAPPRIPEVGEFPPIAQHEYHVKTGNTAAALTPLAGRNKKTDGHAPAPKKRSRLFDRLTGRSGASKTVSAGPENDPADADASFDGFDGAESQAAEIPEFFKRKMRS